MRRPIAKHNGSVLTLCGAAAYLKVSKTHLSNVVRGNVAGVPVLMCARVGRRLLFKREWLDHWLEQTGTLSHR